jgi:phage head maturation protease
MREGSNRMKVLFNHGQDPQLGDQVLGRINELREDDKGAYYEVSLYDGIPSLVMSGLRDRAYGASFRFQMMREDWVDDPGPSEYNPEGIPERTLREVRVAEFGAVTWPAYADATAGVRSLTDHFVFEYLERHPDLVRSMMLATDLSSTEDEDAPAISDAGTSTSDQARRVSRDYLYRKETPAWQL